MFFLIRYDHFSLMSPSYIIICPKGYSYGKLLSGVSLFCSHFRDYILVKTVRVSGRFFGHTYLTSPTQHFPFIIYTILYIVLQSINPETSGGILKTEKEVQYIFFL